MFDTLRSSYDLGPQFTNVELQTKDMDDFGGSLTFYHIDPGLLVVRGLPRNQHL